MAEQPARCTRCKGFALEPEKYPGEPCGLCGGTGRAAPAPAHQKELIDG